MSKASKKKGGSLRLKETTVPAARNYKVASSQPKISTSKNGCVISGAEEISTISGSTSFNATQFSVNPGLAIYNWLSTQAQGWEKYRYRKLEYVYVPAEAVTTTPGSVYLCADYDPEDPAPEDLQQLSTFETFASGRVFEPVTLNVSCSRMSDGIQVKKIRNTPVVSDLQIYDGASVSVATISCTDTSAIGQLWVYYEIELISRQTRSVTNISHTFAQITDTTNQNVITAVDTLIGWDTILSQPSWDITFTAGQPIIPAGRYHISGVMTFKYGTGGGTVVDVIVRCANAAVILSLPKYRKTFTVVGGDYLVVPYSFYLESNSDGLSPGIIVQATHSIAVGQFITVAENCYMDIQVVG